MAFIDERFREILSSQLVSILGGLLAGTVLALYTDRLLLIPGMLVILPGFLEMRGSISGSVASRLSSGLFLGVIRPRRPRKAVIRGNLAASFALAILVSLALGLLAFLFTFLLFGQAPFTIILIPLVAGIIANAIEIPLTLFMTLSLFRRGHDPNNIMGPFVTSTGDITSIVSLLLATVIL